MAEVLDDAEFCLPPQFLTQDDFLMGKKDDFGLELDGSNPLFPYDFHSSFGFSLDLINSPVESLLGSTETESDEEDYLAGLTRHMAHSTLLNDHAFLSHNSKGWVYSSSPQSTLCSVRSGCGCKQGSVHGSFNCQSRASSPPVTWDLMHAAAGEDRMDNESYVGFNNRGILGPPARKPSQNIDVSGFYPPHRSLSHKLKATKFLQLKQQQLMKQQNSSAWGGRHQHHFQNKRGNSKDSWSLGLSPSAWPPQPPQNGSGMRAAFLGNLTGKRECAGTGVFLPRRIGSTPAESRKKPACPARVVQALNCARPNLHLGFDTSCTVDSDAAALSLGGGGSNKQGNFRPQQGINHEVGLPQEWIY